MLALLRPRQRLGEPAGEPPRVEVVDIDLTCRNQERVRLLGASGHPADLARELRHRRVVGSFVQILPHRPKRIRGIGHRGDPNPPPPVEFQGRARYRQNLGQGCQPADGRRLADLEVPGVPHVARENEQLVARDRRLAAVRVPHKHGRAVREEGFLDNDAKGRRRMRGNHGRRSCPGDDRAVLSSGLRSLRAHRDGAAGAGRQDTGVPGPSRTRPLANLRLRHLWPSPRCETRLENDVPAGSIPSWLYVPLPTARHHPGRPRGGSLG